MLDKIFKKLFGDKDQKDLKELLNTGHTWEV